ncbi:MAG: V-type ATPase subunit [Syntrophorhabdaceae bacterium]|nr:V-type ATPase subunit [Syntrophorhabdaceae bacterium]
MIPRIRNFSKWGFVCGRISVLEGNFLPKEFFLNLINQEKTDDIVAMLQDTFLREYISPGAMWLGENFSNIFDRCFNDMAFSLRDDCPSTLPVDLFLIQNDYLNLSNAVKERKDFVFPSCLFSYDILTAIAEGDYADLPKTFKESYAWQTGEIFGINPALLDIIVDGAYLRHLLMFSDATESELIKKYIYMRITSYIIIAMWRGMNKGIPLKYYQQYLSPVGEFNHLIDDLAVSGNIENWRGIIGGEIGEIFFESSEYEELDPISIFDLKVNNYLSNMAHGGAYQTAGPERVFAFLLGLLTEMQNLKLVVIGRINNIDRDFLRARLRECYV